MFRWIKRFVLHIFRREKSGDIARERLKATVLSDRQEEGKALAYFKPALAAVFASYFEMDAEQVILRMQWHGQRPLLVAEMPIAQIYALMPNKTA